MSIAQDRLEELRGFTTQAQYTSQVVSGTQNGIAGTNASYDLTWNVTAVGSPAYKQVSVAVAWSDQEANRQATLTSYVARQDPAADGAELLLVSSFPAPSPGEGEGGTPGDVTEAPTDPGDPGGGDPGTPPGENGTPAPDPVTGDPGSHPITISGGFTFKGNVGMPTVTATSTTGPSVPCTVGQATYLCTLTVPGGATWTGQVQLTLTQSNNVVCAPGTNPTLYSGISSSQTRNYTVAQNLNKCN
jgi:hypothetical protein